MVDDGITQARIDELSRTVPHATIDDLGGMTGSDPQFREDINAYLKNYAARTRGPGNVIFPSEPCICCGEEYAFRWGLEHGTGYCFACKWPGTLYHFIKDRDGNDLTTVRGILLWAHPEFVTLNT